MKSPLQFLPLSLLLSPLSLLHGEFSTESVDEKGRSDSLTVGRVDILAKGEEGVSLEGDGEHTRRRVALSIEVFLLSKPSSGVLEYESAPVLLHIYYDENVDTSVNSFCEEYNVGGDHCDILKAQAKERVANQDLQLRRKRFVILNGHDRIEKAFYNEVNYDARNLNNEGFYPLRVTYQKEDDEISRIAIVHSCSFLEQTYDVLGQMLDTIMHSGLMQQLDALYIMHYGNEYMNQTYVNENANVHYIHVDRSCANFEIPTLQSMIFLANDEKLHEDSHILYMHTKGVSYTNIPKPIHDWRKYMLYFMVTLWQKCYYLMKSGEFDVVGTSLRMLNITHKLEEVTGPMIMGNYFWTTAKHIRSLPPFMHQHKYDAELFILSSGQARVYMLHDAPDDIELGKDEYDLLQYDVLLNPHSHGIMHVINN